MSTRALSARTGVGGPTHQLCEDATQAFEIVAIERRELRWRLVEFLQECRSRLLAYADQGVRVNVVAPGPILTHHLERAGEEAQRQAALSTPMRRIGRPDEVASAVLWLCSEQASFITGAIVPIDGGQYAGLKPPRTYRPGSPMQSDRHASETSEAGQ